ncbi:MAG: thioredoxin family protein, partial [Actinomycetota bacterium]|nr:thioredoxin family protein [Actinomycetota bacterium]
MRVTLRFFDGCPNWHTAQAALREALDTTAHEKVDIVLEKVESPKPLNAWASLAHPPSSSTARTRFA